MNGGDDGIWRWVASVLAAIGATSLAWYGAFYNRCATKRDILDMATRKEVKSMIHEEHGATLAAIVQRLDDQDKRLANGDEKMSDLQRSVCGIATSIGSINGKLDILVGREQQ